MRHWKGIVVPLLMAMQTLLLNLVVLQPATKSLVLGGDVIIQDTVYTDTGIDRLANRLRRLEGDDQSSKSSKSSKSSNKSSKKSNKSSKKSKSDKSHKDSKSSKKSKTASLSEKSSKTSKSISHKSYKSHAIWNKSSKGIIKSKSSKTTTTTATTTTTSLAQMAHHTKMDHQPEGLKETDPLVKDPINKTSLFSSTPFQLALAAAILGTSLIVHYFKSRTINTTRASGNESGGAYYYKPIAMQGGGTAEMTRMGHTKKTNLGAEYGESDDSDDDLNVRAQ